MSSEAAPRWAALARDTNETSIQLALNLDGGAFPPETDSKLLANGADGHASQASKSQTISVNTGIGFLDHMLHALAKHAGWSLAITCKGDLHSESLRRPFWQQRPYGANWSSGPVLQDTNACSLAQSTITTPLKTSASPSAPRSAGP